MKQLAIYALGMLVWACAIIPTPEPLPAAQRSSASMVAGATLASSGTFEMVTAPAYTRLILLRQRAAALLDARRIDVDTARAVQGYADQVRAVLDKATTAAQVEAARDRLALAEDFLRRNAR